MICSMNSSIRSLFMLRTVGMEKPENKSSISTSTSSATISRPYRRSARKNSPPCGRPRKLLERELKTNALKSVRKANWRRSKRRQRPIRLQLRNLSNITKRSVRKVARIVPERKPSGRLIRSIRPNRKPSASRETRRIWNDTTRTISRLRSLKSWPRPIQKLRRR